MQTRSVVATCFALLLSTAIGVEAKPKPKDTPKEGPTEAVDETTAKAREAFLRGTAAVRASQWSEALAAFEEADRIKPAPVVTFNIGYCQRAIGKWVLAKASFDKVLANPAGMPNQQVEEARGLVRECEAQIVRMTITVHPADAKIAIDGRPLVAQKDGDPNVLVAGIAPPGEGTRLPKATMQVIIDAGFHVVQASHPGFGNVSVSKSFDPGSSVTLPMRLDELPAEVRIESDQPRAVVLVDGRDVGLAPITLTRPSGRYRVQVQKKGFVGYETTFALTPGQKAHVTARLSPERDSVVQKWWFWGGAAAVVAGGITATYFLTRPDPSPPDYERGNLGWLASPR